MTRGLVFITILFGSGGLHVPQRGLARYDHLKVMGWLKLSGGYGKSRAGSLNHLGVVTREQAR